MTDRKTLAERLRRIPTTIAADVLKEASLPERSPVGLAAVTSGTGTVAGPVRTIRFLPGRPELRARSGPPLNFELIDAVEPDEVLVLAAGGSMRGAVLGDMLAARARQLGAAGAIVDGAVRDLAGLEEVGLPVFARGVAPMAAHASLVPVEGGGAVRFGGVTVLPEDWVLADRDGVLFLPLDLVELLMERVEAASLRDAVSRELLLAGFALGDVFPLPERLQPILEHYRMHRRLPDRDAVARAVRGA